MTRSVITRLTISTSLFHVSGFQNGYWFIKLAALIGLAVGAFYLPPNFALYWMYICIAASTVYIVIQVRVCITASNVYIII